MDSRPQTIKRVDGKRGDLPTSGVKPNSRYDLYVNEKKYKVFLKSDKTVCVKKIIIKNIMQENSLIYATLMLICQLILLLGYFLADVEIY